MELIFLLVAISIAIIIAGLYLVRRFGNLPAIGACTIVGAGLLGGWCYFSSITDQNVAHMVIIMVPLFIVIGGVLGAVLGTIASIIVRITP